MSKIFEIIVCVIAAVFVVLFFIPIEKASSAVIHPDTIVLPDTAPIPTPRPNIKECE